MCRRRSRTSSARGSCCRTRLILPDSKPEHNRTMKLTCLYVCVQADDVKKAEPYFERTWRLLQDALDIVPKELHGIKLKPPPPVCPHPACCCEGLDYSLTAHIWLGKMHQPNSHTVRL